MYDHNFFYVTNKITNDDLDYLIKYQKENNYDFIKIVSNINLELDNSFEKDTILILIKDNSFDIKDNKLLSFSNLKDNPKYAKDILNFEKRYYGKRFGYDFCNRKTNRDLEMATNKDSKLNYYIVLIDNQVVGYCHFFISKKVVMVDDLLVIKKYRNKYVASNLIKYIYETYKYPLLLHASDLDTSKEMYFKLGFKEVEREYEYFKKF